MTGMRRREHGHHPPRSAVWGSVVLHAAVAAFLLIAGSSMAPPLPAQTYRVRLVAAADAKAPERLVPKPARVEKEEFRPPPPQPVEKRTPRVKKPAVVKQKPTAEPSTEPARAPEAGEEAVNVQLDGAIFAFPEYLQNIIRQVNRYWRPPTDGRALRAEIVFVILKDGSVTDLEWRRRSGDAAFDLEARGAIETAGRSRAFGPLPDAYPGDRLRVSFFFDPSRR
ncbi:MAG: TonB C-terminal domain-containing protein [Gemmatimonadota bacterium]